MCYLDVPVTICVGPGNCEEIPVPPRSIAIVCGQTCVVIVLGKRALQNRHTVYSNDSARPFIDVLYVSLSTHPIVDTRRGIRRPV